MPWASSSMSRLSPSHPGKDRCALPGSRDGPPSTTPVPGSPLTVASGTVARILPTRSSRSPARVAARRAEPAGRQLDRGGQAHHGGGVQGAGPHVALLAATVQDRRERDLPPEQQHARPDGAAQLVPGEAERIDSGRAEVHRQHADGLHGVGVHRDAEVVGDGGELTDRVDRADLVVGPHDRDQRDPLGFVGESGAQRLGTDAAELVDLEQLHLGALVLAEPLRRVEHGVVLDRRDEHPHAAVGRRRGATSRGPSPPCCRSRCHRW